MSRPILAIQCEALFASHLQSSQHPNDPQIRLAIRHTLATFGVRYCACRVAQEFGDHPDTAVPRMLWAREAVARAYPNGTWN